jgi:hypothetical protein
MPAYAKVPRNSYVSLVDTYFLAARVLVQRRQYIIPLTRQRLKLSNQGILIQTPHITPTLLIPTPLVDQKPQTIPNKRQECQWHRNRQIDAEMRIDDVIRILASPVEHGH